ncbi:MAG: UMP kinase [Patescibacteria group bacterium]
MKKQTSALKRVLLKISGEVMSGNGKTGFDKEAIQFIAHEIHDAVKTTDCQIAIVIGGGNLIRGSRLVGDIGSSPIIADQAGMLATVINGIILQDFLEKTHGLEIRVMSAVEVRAFTEPYIRRRAMAHMDKGRIVVLAGGSANPRFTTDTAAVLRAIELEAEIVIKGTKVDGVYSKDPNAHQDSVFIEQISQHDFITQKLGILDRTAVTLAGENKMPIRVLNILKKGNIAKALQGESIGSLIIPD